MRTMRGNHEADPRAGRVVTVGDVCDEMRAYDALPIALREVLANAPVQATATTIPTWADPAQIAERIMAISRRERAIMYGVRE